MGEPQIFIFNTMRGDETFDFEGFEFSLIGLDPYPKDGVELKKEAPPVAWRFCQACHHAKALSTTVEPEPQCPACGDARWGDVGQTRDVLLLGQVFSVSQHRDALLGDDGDDREKSYYHFISLFEATADARDAWSNDPAGFGFELQPRMILRQLNLGPQKDSANAQLAQIAGQSVIDVRFEICGTCGQAQSPDAGRSGDVPRAAHRAWCAERKKDKTKYVPRRLHLLRELKSEALRLVVPFAASEYVQSDLANLRAALRVGLRKFYGGDPDFLDVQAYDEPLPAREGRRRFLVIMDRVPGGTGLLAELCLDKGAKLKQALEKAHDALRHCACHHRDPAVKACYQCLYAYREGNDLPLLDRVRGMEILERLLDAFGDLAKVDSIGTMSQSLVLESELEARFVRGLEALIVAQPGGTWKRENDGAWKLSVGRRHWLLRAQVELKADKVEVPCRADFVLYPEPPGEGVLPVAVFTDGLAFHVMPGSPSARLGDDARKRRGISQGGDMLSWSLTWKDVVSPDSPVVQQWFGSGAPFTKLQAMAFRLDAERTEKLGILLRLLDSDPLRALVAYLEAPTRFAELAPLAAFMLLQNGGKRQPGARIAKAHEQWRELEDVEDVALDTSEGDVATVKLDLGAHARLLLDVEGAHLGTLLAEPQAARATLRLEDDSTARSAPTFELSWRLWLRAWNLLQVLPGASLITRSAVASGPMEQAAEAPGMPAAVAKLPSDATDPRFRIVREVQNDAAVEVLLALLIKHPRLAAPSVPLELRPPAFATHDDVELGWPELKVAAYFDYQSAAAAALRASGWAVLSIERGLTVLEFEQSLGLNGSN